MKICQQHKDEDEDNYVILLILTDGEVFKNKILLIIIKF